jgi:hypothetical protein
MKFEREASTTSGSNWIPGELSQLRERLFRGQWCHSIGSLGSHGFESVGHVEDSSESRDLLANEPVG